ncbi:MAG: thermosome subunit alpha [Candidatus Woesearchaeota archaeon]|jgi:thermosome
MSNKMKQSIMPDEAQRTMGKDAQRNNILAGKLVAETVRTTLGPKGMDKMLVDSLGDVVVTNDGVTILREMQIEHPAAKMIVEIAKTQEAEVGDGTTTAVIIAGELLKNAEALLDSNIHPSVITKGYKIATDKALEIVRSFATKININDRIVLKNIVETAITGKGPEDKKNQLAELIVTAVKAIEQNGKVDKEDIKIQKVIGGGVDDSYLVEGIVIDKDKVHESMPTVIANPKIALLNSPLEIRETEIDAKISITDPMQMQAFIDQEDMMIKRIVDKVKKSGANVVFCQKGVDDLAAHYLANECILVSRRIKKSDMESLSRATGAKIINSLDDLKPDCLGFAGKVEERKVGEEKMIFVEKCKNPKTVTLVLKGGTEHIVDEVKRACEDAIGDLKASLETGFIVAGGGSAECEISRKLRAFAESLGGREQLAVKAYADALEVIPKTLAENAGFDPIDILTELKSAHNAGKIHAGVNAYTGKIVDMMQEGVIEPLKVKTQAIQSAGEVSVMILRIDDVILASGLSRNAHGPGMPSPDDMGGM